MRGYTVVGTFTDDQSGSAVDRPGMKRMLAFLKKHRQNPHVVIIDDISRLARGVEAHIRLRGAISIAGGLLESPSVEFGEDADSELQEYILATVAQHQRRKNAEQTKNRMRSRVLNGYWPFPCPIGYRYEKVSGHGKMLKRNEPLASIIQEGLEGYASGRFQLQAEVKRFFEAHPMFPRGSNGQIPIQRVTDILSRPVYAGHVGAPDWDVPLRKGQHEGLISFETFQKIQERIHGKARVPARKDISADFPLRGAVLCGECSSPLTACWSQGRMSRHAYYFCNGQGCQSYRKSIRRDDIEGQFIALLQGVKPAESVFRTAFFMFKDLWAHRASFAKAQTQTLKQELASIERKVGQFLDRIADTDIPSVIAAYETRIRSLEEQRLLFTEKLAGTAKPAKSFDESVRTALEFLANPCILWGSNRIEDKRIALKLAFGGPLSYVRNQGVQTPILSLPFNTLGSISCPESEMARPAGVEPATHGLEGRCSIQLSYGRVAWGGVTERVRRRLETRSWMNPASQELAERAGFEPAIRFDPYTRFPGVLLKPLGHLSGKRH